MMEVGVNTTTGQHNYTYLFKDLEAEPIYEKGCVFFRGREVGRTGNGPMYDHVFSIHNLIHLELRK